MYKFAASCPTEPPRHTLAQVSVLKVFGATAPPVGQGLFIHEVSRSHKTTHHSR